VKPTAQHWILDVYRLSSFRSGIEGRKEKGPLFYRLSSFRSSIEGRKEEGTIILPGNVNTEMMLLEKKRPAAEKEPDLLLLPLHQCGAIRRWPGS
jgi:hypothetical protein